jgi:hypothetical protein
MTGPKLSLPRRHVYADCLIVWAPYKRQRVPEQAYSFAVDAFAQQRVLKLRDEIAVLRHENGVYRSQKHHSLEQWHMNDVRRFRLLAIREELRSLSQGGWHVGGLAGKMRER